MRVYEFARSFSEAAATYLDPERRLKEADGVYRALYFLTIDRWVTGFRSYSANIVTGYTERFSLENALIRLWQLGKRLPYRPPFGGNYVNIEKPWDHFVQAVDSLLPGTVQKPLALLLHNLADAVSWYHRLARFSVCSDQKCSGNGGFCSYDAVPLGTVVLSTTAGNSPGRNSAEWER